MSVNLVLVAACALIDPDGRVLIAQRPEGKAMAGLWEFPGGKVEDGERPEESLIREWDAAGTNVFVYFNNDGDANAVRNARTLRAILAGRLI